MVDGGDLVAQQAAIGLVEVDALPDDRLVVAVQRNAAGIVGPGALHVACFHGRAKSKGARVPRAGDLEARKNCAFPDEQKSAAAVAFCPQKTPGKRADSARMRAEQYPLSYCMYMKTLG